MQILRLTIFAVSVMAVSFAPVSAQDQFAASTTCDSNTEASFDRPDFPRETVDCADCGTMFKPFTFFHDWGITVGGHIDQGVTTNSRNPTNPAVGVGNLPATQDNYRNDEYMLNSTYVTIGRETDTGGSGWDVGGSIDLIYGTNYVFLQSRGLELNRDLSNRWNSDNGAGFGGVGLMGLALPQMYLEVAHDALTVQLGHFYLPLGYEHPIPTHNFHYSNSYGSTFSFEGCPVLGMYANWELNDALQIGGGFHRGLGNWEDNNDDLSGFGTMSWIDDDGNRSLLFQFNIGNEADTGTQTLYVQSLTFEQEIGERWSYVIYSDFGFQNDALAGGGTAYWYNVVQYVAYQINPCWTAGIRFEWFDDIDGFVVAPTPGPGVFYGLTLGLNYTPTDKVIVRPEVRWDWFDADTGVGPGPFKDGTERSQFTAAVDVIFSF